MNPTATPIAETPDFELEIGAAKAVSLERLAGWTLTSVSTRIWLTEENGGRDIWLLPGDRHLVAGSGRVVVEAWPIAGTGGNQAAARIRLAPPVGKVGGKWRLPVPALPQAAAWA